MRKPHIHLNQTIAAGLAAMVLACLVPLTSGHAASKPYTQAFPTDSLVRMAAGYYKTEPDVRSILDGLNADVRPSDTIGEEAFCASRGAISVGAMKSYSSLAAQVSLMWYPKGSPDAAIAVLPIQSAPGDSGVFFLADPDSIGWCVHGPAGLTWYSEANLNSDSKSHVRFYATNSPGAYVMCWEDMPSLGDGDFNDFVAWIRLPHIGPEIELSYANNDAAANRSACLSIVANSPAGGSEPITVRKLQGPGDFSPVTGFGAVEASHCFTPSENGLYTFIFEASAASAGPVIDTLVVPAFAASVTTPPPHVTVNLDNNFTVCYPETLRVPFHVTASCQVTNIHTKLPAFINFADSTIRIVTGIPFEGCFYIIAQDACGGKDSSSVCFIVETNTPATYTCPGRLDTSLCETGWACYPMSVSGGDPPVQVTAVSPAYFNSVMHQVCYPIDASGVYQSKLVIQNASCPPETCVTEIHASINTPPRIVGIPNTTVSVCGTAPYCFGPITAVDDQGNITSFVQIKGPGTLSGQNWCYTPTGTQTVSAIFRATDACNKQTLDTLKVSFTATSTPVITFNSITTQLCGPQTVCVPYSVNSGGGPAPVLSLIGPGTLDAANSRVCLTINATGNYSLTLQATPPCGPPVTKTATIHATMNLPPEVTCTAPDVDTIAPGTEVCIPYTVTDPNGETLSISIQGPGFTIPRQAVSGTSSEVCYAVASQGVQTVRIIVSDACGAADTCISSFPVWFNSGPSVTARDTNVFLCAPQAICLPVTCSDPDNNLVICDAEGSKPGIFNGGAFCFTPDTAGTYTVDLYAEDAFGSYANHTTVVRVSYNTAPHVQISGASSVTITAGQTACFNYSVTDPDGNLSTVVSRGNVASFGGGQICVMGIYGEVVCAWVVATDVCGRKDSAQVCVSSTPGFSPHPNLPDTVEVRLCAAGDICVPFSIPPSGCPPMTLTALGGGVIESGGTDTSLCLTLTQPGVYHTGVTATDLCGQETAEVVVIVSPNNPPQIVCPQSDVFFTCDADTMCVTIAYADPDSNFMEATASYGILQKAFKGLFEICMPVDTSGWYRSRIIVRDSCGLADTCNFATQVLHNTPPQIVAPGDTSIFLCYPTQVCLPVGCFDPDYNFASCAPVSLGDATWNGTSLCFTPLVSGLYEWVFKAQDLCGESDIDTVRANVQINRPPTITAPATIYAAMCQPESVLVNYQISDPDGDPLICYIDGCEQCSGQIKVYSDTSGTICYNLIVRDQCFAADTARVCVTFDINKPPVVTAPPDFAALVCDLGTVCFDVGIQDDWTKRTASVTPVGTYNANDGTVCFFADTAGTYRLIVTATDSCGAVGKDTVNVTVEYNVPPVVTAPSQAATLCTPGQVCVGGIRVYDANANLRRFYLATPGAVFDSSAGTLCFDADAAGLYCFDIAAEDSCGDSDLRTICINVALNQGPSVTINGLDGSPVFFEPTQMCFTVNATDPNAGQLFDLEMIQGGGTFTRQVAHAPLTANHCFLADTSGCYRFIFESTDSCGLSARDTATVCISVEIPDTMFQVCIDTVESLNGRNATVKVRGYQMKEMGGYDFLICYDPTMLNFSQAATDSALTTWEYFTYRVGSATGCLPCGASSIRLIGIADMNNGSPHPPDWAFTPKGPLHKLTFFVTPDRTFLNQCAPIRFCFYDCGDNTISSKSGDSLYTDVTGVPDTCFGGGKYPPIPLIDYCDGLICIVPPEDDRGDINLNGIANEVSDAVLFSNYFIYGNVVWDPIYKENQILATDVNCDGLVLTIADLVKLIRLVTGDDQPQGCADGPAKVAAQPSHAARISAERSAGGIEFWSESDIDLGGVFIKLSTQSKGFSNPLWDKDLGGLTPQFNSASGEMRFLLLSMQSNSALPSGRQHLFTLPWDGSGQWDITDVQSAGVDGELVSTEIGAGADPLPRSHSLSQNYPNPFNASTQIRFSLGRSASWEVSVYNVLGQIVRRFEGANEAGDVSIEWDAKTSTGDDLASGVYFARLKVGDFTATRKMVLLK